MNSQEYNQTTPRVFDLSVQGLERKIKQQELLQLDSWRQARFTVYHSLLPYMNKEISIYDFFPLPDDPTVEERKLIELDQHEQDMAHAREVYNKFFERQKQKELKNS